MKKFQFKQKYRCVCGSEFLWESYHKLPFYIICHCGKRAQAIENTAKKKQYRRIGRISLRQVGDEKEPSYVRMPLWRKILMGFRI
jgi:hypothetical protein